MLLAPRTFGLLAMIPLLVALGALSHLFLVAAGIWLLVLSALLLADCQLTAAPQLWSCERQHDARFSLGAFNQVRVRVRMQGGVRPARFWLRDTPPSLFVIGNVESPHTPHTTISQPMRVLDTAPPAATFVDTIAPHSSLDLRYWVVPPQRGDFTFGDIYLRWTSPLGLIRRQAPFPQQGHVKVFPNLAEIRKYDLLLRRQRTWEMGVRATRRRGTGTEFEQLRDYIPDDEYRRISWMATARRAKPISIDYQTERSQNIVLLLDIGRMMQSRVASMSKLDYAINAALLLAYVATQKGDRVGLLTFADTVQTWIAPRTGRGQFQRLLTELYAVKSIPVEPDYSAAFAHLAAHHRRRSLLIVVTDLLESLSFSQLAGQLIQQIRRHLLLLVTLQNPEIIGLAHASVEDSDTLYQRTVASRLLDERALALANLQNLGILALDVAANQLNVALIDRYLDLKSRSTL